METGIQKGLEYAVANKNITRILFLQSGAHRKTTLPDKLSA